MCDVEDGWREFTEHSVNPDSSEGATQSTESVETVEPHRNTAEAAGDERVEPEHAECCWIVVGGQWPIYAPCLDKLADVMAYHAWEDE